VEHGTIRLARSTRHDRVDKPLTRRESSSRDMTVAIEMGFTPLAVPAALDLEERLATRLIRGIARRRIRTPP